MKEIGQQTLRRWTVPVGAVLLVVGVAVGATLERHRLPARPSPGVRTYIVIAVAVAAAGAMLLAQRRLAQAAHVDPLTGLPNRRRFQQRITAALRSARRRESFIAVLLIDLDRFKEVNDTLGHHAGDRLLVDVASRLSGHVRDADVLARLGGDEFAVLVTSAEDDRGAEELARRLVDTLAAPFQLGEHTIQIGGSIGIAVHPRHGDTEEELLQRADTAMYFAKRGRHGSAMYAALNDANSERRLALTADVVAAADRHQITVLYQPKISVATGEVTGLEALVRWNHPKLGMITPSEFVALAEETGAIGVITQRVIAQVLEHWAPQQRIGLRLPVAINLSTRDLLDGAVPLVIGENLRRWGIDGTWLTFEITETAAITDEVSATLAVTAIRSLGCRVAIDDFGTGFFSLAGLRRLPIDELKIDRSFVAAMLTSAPDAYIVRAVIRLAHDLDLRVVAEGVESDEVLAELGRLGCDDAQGFHLGRPMSASEVQRWLGTRRLQRIVETVGPESKAAPGPLPAPAIPDERPFAPPVAIGPAPAPSAV